MTLQALIIGGTGGIGSSCAKQLVDNDYKISLLNSDQLDLNFPERIFDHDFSKFDFTKSQLYKRRSGEIPNVEPVVLPPLTTRPVLAPLTISTPTSTDNIHVPPLLNPEKYTVSPIATWYAEQQLVSE